MSGMLQVPGELPMLFARSKLTLEDLGAYVVLGAHCANIQTDGVVDVPISMLWSSPDFGDRIEALISAGHVERHGEALLLPKFLEHNKDAVQMEQIRSQGRDRKKRWQLHQANVHNLCTSRCSVRSLHDSGDHSKCTSRWCEHAPDDLERSENVPVERESDALNTKRLNTKRSEVLRSEVSEGSADRGLGAATATPSLREPHIFADAEPQAKAKAKATDSPVGAPERASSSSVTADKGNPFTGPHIAIDRDLTGTCSLCGKAAKGNGHQQVSKLVKQVAELADEYGIPAQIAKPDPATDRIRLTANLHHGSFDCLIGEDCQVTLSLKGDQPDWLATVMDVTLSTQSEIGRDEVTAYLGVCDVEEVGAALSLLASNGSRHEFSPDCGHQFASPNHVPPPTVMSILEALWQSDLSASCESLYEISSRVHVIGGFGRQGALWVTLGVEDIVAPDPVLHLAIRPPVNMSVPREADDAALADHLASSDRQVPWQLKRTKHDVHLACDVPLSGLGDALDAFTDDLGAARTALTEQRKAEREAAQTAPSGQASDALEQLLSSWTDSGKAGSA